MVLETGKLTGKGGSNGSTAINEVGYPCSPARALWLDPLTSSRLRDPLSQVEMDDESDDEATRRGSGSASSSASESHRRPGERDATRHQEGLRTIGASAAMTPSHLIGRWEEDDDAPTGRDCLAFDGASHSVAHGGVTGSAAKRAGRGQGRKASSPSDDAEEDGPPAKRARKRVRWADEDATDLAESVNSLEVCRAFLPAFPPSRFASLTGFVWCDRRCSSSRMSIEDSRSEQSRRNVSSKRGVQPKMALAPRKVRSFGSGPKNGFKSGPHVSDCKSRRMATIRAACLLPWDLRRAP